MDTRRDILVTIRVNAYEREVLARLAARKHLTVSDYLRDLIRREAEREQVDNEADSEEPARCA
jgi:hypothetical protein